MRPSGARSPSTREFSTIRRSIEWLVSDIRHARTRTMALMRTLARPTVWLAIVGALSACGGDATGPSSTPALSSQEARAVAVAIFEEIDRALGDTAAFSPSRASRA